TPPPVPEGAKQAEDLDRGLISVRSGSGNLVSWRLLGTEPRETAFNVYRGGTRVATVTDSTNYLDSGAPSDATYTDRPVNGGAEGPASEPSLRLASGDLDVPISPPSTPPRARRGGQRTLRPWRRPRPRPERGPDQGRCWPLERWPAGPPGAR